MNTKRYFKTAGDLVDWLSTKQISLAFLDNIVSHWTQNNHIIEVDSKGIPVIPKQVSSGLPMSCFLMLVVVLFSIASCSSPSQRSGQLDKTTRYANFLVPGPMGWIKSPQVRQIEVPKTAITGDVIAIEDYLFIILETPVVKYKRGQVILPDSTHTDTLTVVNAVALNRDIAGKTGDDVLKVIRRHSYSHE